MRLIGSSKLGTKTEIKNMNSFRSVHRAIESEIERQITVIESGGRVVQETRGWDEITGTTIPMRSKEQAHDYRYFPDPDLVPLEISTTDVERMRSELPELPWQRFDRYTREYALNAKQATQLIDNPPLAQYFDRVVETSGNPQQSTNFVLGELSRLANDNGIAVAESRVSPEGVAELIALVESRTVNSKIAKELVERMWNGEASPKAIVEREGLAQTSDAGALDRLVEEVLGANGSVVAEYHNGKTNVMGYLIGRVMQASRGKADPKLVSELVKKRLG